MTKVASWIRGRGAVVAAIAVGAAWSIACGSSGSDERTPSEAGANDSSVSSDGTLPGNDTGVGDGGAAVDTGVAPPFDGGPLCDPDAAAIIDCTGKCGPVQDPCTGTVKLCGGCSPVQAVDGGLEPRACDLATNTCIKPKVTCADLGAECGTVQDTCGNFLDCPDTPIKGCAAGKECDPDTHRCVDCEAVTCADLGYECGRAYLGCGPDTQANYTDCGECPNDADGGLRTCNSVFHNCEPKCVPGTAAQLCAAAKAKNGVECGFISNGCGGVVSCDGVTGFGCKTGQSCGVRGIANRCDPYETPPECSALGQNCGDITSACTGVKVHCGDCAAGGVCNANGVCGKPCAAKTCADYPGLECGSFDDGCGSTLKCGSCGSGVCDQASNTCCAAKACGIDYANHCGTGLATGCGATTEPCPCAGGVCTADGGAAPAPPAGALGACCSPHASSYYVGMNQCGTNLADGCGGKVTANCPSGQECVANSTGAAGPAPGSGVVGTCCTPSCALAANTCGAIQDTCRPPGTNVTCNKCAAGTPSCVGSTCCTPPPACGGGGGEGGECNIQHDTGCGSPNTCNCAGGRTCWCTNHACVPGTDPAGVCKSALTCSSTPYKNKCGTGLDNGIGGTLDCSCATGMNCSVSASGATGSCSCPAGTPYTCGNVPNGPSKAGGNACGTFDNGCGGTINCGCPTGQSCNTGPTPSVCCTSATCPIEAIGSACGAVSNGCSTVNCGCPTGTGNENFSCSAGHCACTPDTCRGRTGAQPDRCGGTLQCGG